MATTTRIEHDAFGGIEVPSARGWPHYLRAWLGASQFWK